MKRQRPIGSAALLLVLFVTALLAVPTVGVAAQAPVPLGRTSIFAVLAGSTVTNTGSTTIGGDAGGDVGVSGGSAITGFPPAVTTGVLHSNDATAIAAQTDLVTAYTDAAGRTPVTRIVSELGGAVLKPGVYDSADGTFKINGALTLDAEGDPDGVFIFLTNSTLITGSSSRITLINSARYCRVFWKIGTSATLGTDSHFVGHIFADASITANTRASIQGQLLAHTGAVTLDANDITNGICVSAQGAAIDITKTASPTALTSGAGSVTYTYKVTNPGRLPLSGVVVTDNKVSPVNYVSGDVNSDKLLQPGETWIYTATTRLAATTTNTGTASGIGNGVTAIDTSVVTVSVTGTGTVTGGEIPDTGTPWYGVLFLGIALAFVGAAGLWRVTRRSHG